MNFRNKTFVALAAIAALSSVAIAQPALNVKGSNFGGNQATFRTNAGLVGTGGEGMVQATFLQAAGFNVVAMPSVDIDWNAGSYFTKTLTGNTTFTFSNVRPGKTITLVLGTPGGWGVNWPAGVTWDGGTPGTPAAGGSAAYTFIGSGGTATRGFAPAQGTLPLPIARGGTGNTTGAVPAASLSGSSLPASITGSSLTSLGTLASLNATGTIATTGAVQVTTNGRVVTIGSTGLSAGFAYLSFADTPSATNYTLLGSGGDSYFNGSSNIYLRTGNSDRATVTGSGINITQNTASTTTGTGSLIVAGGTGIGGAVNVGGSITGNATTNTLPNQTDSGTAAIMTRSLVTSLVSGPKFFAKCSAVQSVPDSTNTKLNFASEDWDTASVYDTATSRFTPNKAGYYQINISIRAATNANSTQVILFKNGVAHRYLVQSNNHGVVTFSAAALVSMNGTTDYIEVYVWQNKSSALDIGTSDGTHTQFSGALIY